jgi:hypothetical protein
MDHPRAYSDTDPRAMAVWIDLLRKKSPGEKLSDALAYSDLVFGFAQMGVRMQYPDASPREVFLRAAARHLSRDLMIRAYGWDPEEHDDLRGRA